MSVRAFFNSVKEGFNGIFRHPLVTIASVTTILLMLIIMSTFFIFSLYARSIMIKLGQQPPIEVYMKLQCSEDDLANMRNVISSDTRIISNIERSPEQNYDYFKGNLGSSSSIMDDFDYNMYLPYTFSIQISNPSEASAVVMELQGCSGVSKVSQESRVMELLSKAGHVVNVATVASFFILFIIALFIISNMVRISVYSRSSEIEIMKFVGATNFYIRMPYVIEGGIVGLISAICAWGLTSFIYFRIYVSAMSQIAPGSFYALPSVGKITWWILVICAFMGMFIGGIGSGISVRKYIEV